MGGETDLFSLIETGRFYELLDAWNGLSRDSVEKLSESAIPFSEVEYGPLYRRPRKIWGIGLNYVEHAGDLSETAPPKNRRALCARTRPSLDRANK